MDPSHNNPHTGAREGTQPIKIWPLCVTSHNHLHTKLVKPNNKTPVPKILTQAHHHQPRGGTHLIKILPVRGSAYRTSVGYKTLLFKTVIVRNALLLPLSINAQFTTALQCQCTRPLELSSTSTFPRTDAENREHDDNYRTRI